MKYKYTYQGPQEKIVKIVGRHLPISRKTSSEIARFIKRRKVDQAIQWLGEVAEAKRAVPFIRRKKDVPHRKGPMSVGRFPRNASIQIKKLLEQLRTNAKEAGLKEEDLIVIHAVAQPGPVLRKYGRQRGRRKVAHFEIVATEAKPKKKDKKEEKKEDKK